MLAKGEAFVVHSFLDLTVDHYLRVVDRLQAEGSEIEAEGLANELPLEQTQKLYVLRRELLKMKIEHGFREVIDHVRGAREEIDALRERLGLAFEASLLTGQAQQTEISRRLAA